MKLTYLFYTVLPAAVCPCLSDMSAGSSAHNIFAIREVSQFLGRTPNGISALCHDLCWLLSFDHHKVSGSCISRTVWSGITKFYADIITVLVYSHTIQVCSYFQSKVNAIKLSKMLPLMALGQISRELFKQGSQNFTALSGTISRTNEPDMTSLTAFSRLQIATEYCIKVRKSDPAGKESNISVTVWRHIMFAEISKLSDAAFRLTKPIGGLLVAEYQQTFTTQLSWSISICSCFLWTTNHI